MKLFAPGIAWDEYEHGLARRIEIFLRYSVGAQHAAIHTTCSNRSCRGIERPTTAA